MQDTPAGPHGMAPPEFLRESWDRTWAVLALAPEPGLYERLLGCYQEPHRHYHTVEHLCECLGHWQTVMDVAEQPGEVELALWFHDAVYARGRDDNERQSARWAEQVLRAAGAAAPVVERVSALVMATRHAAVPDSPDAALLVDIDLAILGADPERYARYEQQVREEYAWVPAWLFRRKRRALLRAFLGRPSIYSTAHFRALLEARARDNLRLALGARAGS